MVVSDLVVVDIEDKNLIEIFCFYIRMEILMFEEQIFIFDMMGLWEYFCSVV